MRSILLISINDLRQFWKDPGLLLLMFAAPLGIATIISLTFGGLADESSPIESLPIALINEDRGSPFVDFGEQFALIVDARDGDPAAPDEPGAVDARAGAAAPGRGAASIVPGLEAYLAESREEAERWLRQGVVSAVVILPADLSRTITSARDGAPAAVQVITRPDREVSGDIVVSLSRGLIDGFRGAFAQTQAVAAAVSQGEGVSPQGVLSRDSFGQLTQGNAAQRVSPIRLERQAQSSGGIGFDPLVAFGATQAIFFALFTANGNATSVLEEERDGTFLRLLVSPNRRATILAGKLISTVVMVLVQLVLLVVAFTVIGSLIEGAYTFIWGERFGLLAATLLTTSAAAAGIGAIVAALAKNAEQAGTIGTVINMFMAVVGGAFGFRLASPIRYASLVYWGADAFETLAAGGSDIALNLFLMSVLGAVGFGFALLLFHRRYTR
jgi:ABC-2 type transport system permease protein